MHSERVSKLNSIFVFLIPATRYDDITVQEYEEARRGKGFCLGWKYSFATGFLLSLLLYGLVVAVPPCAVSVHKAPPFEVDTRDAVIDDDFNPDDDFYATSSFEGDRGTHADNEEAMKL